MDLTKKHKLLSTWMQTGRPIHNSTVHQIFADFLKDVLALNMASCWVRHEKSLLAIKTRMW